jgi:glycosyltransferase involved in cell wall biosynthesis
MNELSFPHHRIRKNDLDPTALVESGIENLIIIVRADPIVCGHSTEARNLAEAALDVGMKNVHIVSYPLDTLEGSGLPLKPLDSIAPYSEGISIDRPEAIGNYKVLDGRLGLGIGGHIVDLLHKYRGRTAVMDLYLVPHGQMVMSAVDSFRSAGHAMDVVTIGEAVGSDITNVVGNAVAEGRFGAAQIVLSNYLDHDLPVAVSEFTKKLIVEAGAQVDDALGTHFRSRLESRVGISYPAIDTSYYLGLEHRPDELAHYLGIRGLQKDGYLMFLSRIASAKGVDDLIHAYRASSLYQEKPLIICGNGPERDAMMELAGEDNGRCMFFLDDVSDEEKGFLMHGSYAYLLPSKPRTEFVETFGIAVAEKMLAGGLGPVITTTTGGIPEASGGFCLEHEAGNVDDLRSKIDEVHAMSDAQREELGQFARHFALRFDRANVLRGLLERCRISAAA